MFEANSRRLREQMDANDIDVALITDDDSIYYFTGYYDFLHMEFGRPTILVVSRDEESLLITPSIDLNAALAHAKVDRVEAWNDGLGDEWREHLPSVLQPVLPPILGRSGHIAIESHLMPPLVRTYVESLVSLDRIVDISEIVATMRMIKSSTELQLARHAGEVANAMMAAGRLAIAEGVPEYRVALATAEAGTEKAAELLAAHYGDADMSPNTHFLQIMASGRDVIKTHHRASTRVMANGEPVFLCFCGMTNFHRFKLGFDRTFWIGEIGDASQADVYQVAVDSQAAALAVLRPGITGEEVHAAYAEVIQRAGYDYPFRCGRGTGFSFLEQPQLVAGDTTVIRRDMVFAIDGSVSTESFRAQVGDSFIVTDDGYDPITSHPKTIDDVILH